MTSKAKGFAVWYDNGFLAATYLAKNAADVRRAVAFEWGSDRGFKIRQVPASTVGDGGMQGDRHADLTGNQGWADLIPCEAN